MRGEFRAVECKDCHGDALHSGQVVPDGHAYSSAFDLNRGRRGAFGRPWFPAQVRHYLKTAERLADPDLATQRDTVIAHYLAILAHYGDERGLRIARKHVNRYLERLGLAKQGRRQVLRQDNSGAVMQNIMDLYEQAMQREAA